MKRQTAIFESGNELAAYAAKQINYHIMGYYPITPSTQIAEHLDLLKSEGEHDVTLIPADGEHGAAGICYGASCGGGRVFNATSANGLLYALEQMPVQSGTRMPMVLNVACRSVSGPLSIKGDHSDIMYALNAGWLIFFAKSPQAVYDLNIIALKAAERVRLPAIVAFDGFFTSHQKRNADIFALDSDVSEFLGKYEAAFAALDVENPVTIGAYMNEPDLINNKFQLHLAMEAARTEIPNIFAEYELLSGRRYSAAEEYNAEDADAVMLIMGSAYETAKIAVDNLRGRGKKTGLITPVVLRPFFGAELAELCRNAKVIIVADRQDSYGAGGGNLSLELKAALQDAGLNTLVLSRVYGLSGRDFYAKDAERLFEEAFNEEAKRKGRVKFDYYGTYAGAENVVWTRFFEPVNEKNACAGIAVTVDEQSGELEVSPPRLADLTAVPKRLAPGHGACPGCGIPVNVNLLLKGITGNVVLLFQTGCGMVVTTPYPKTAFRVPYVHNLFQNGAATLSGLAQMYKARQRRGELPEGRITFIMVSGDGGLDIGMGAAIGTALRNEGLIIFEYDNGGYMNTGYQLSYSTPMGAKSATSHLGGRQRGKMTFHKDDAQIFAATHMPYVATVAESNPADFVRKAAKAQYYANNVGTAYIKALSACPLNWGDDPQFERSVIEAAVNCCYHPLYEVENGVTSISYNPEEKNKKIPAAEWFAQMGRTKHLAKKEFADITEQIQTEIDRRWNKLLSNAKN